MSNPSSKKPVAPPAPVAVAKPNASPAKASAEELRNRPPPSHFLRDVLIVAVLSAGGLALYYKRVQTSTTVNHVAKKAKDLIEKDTPADFFEAEKQLKKALELDPSNAYCLSALAEINALLWGEDGVADRKQPAQEYAQKADALDPHFAERYSADSLVLLYDGRPKEAEASVRAILDKGAKGGRLNDALGRALRAEGRMDEAVKAFSEASKAGRIPRFNLDLAETYADQGDATNADTYLTRALESNPDSPRAQIFRAAIGIPRGQHIKEATDDLASLLGPRKGELTPTLVARAFTARARLKLFNKQPAEAVRDAEAAIKADPKLAQAHQTMGIALIGAGNVGQALNEFDRAQALDPYVQASYFDAAQALVAADQADKAIAMVQKVNPKDEHFHLVYGDLLAKKGDAAGALAQYDEVLKGNNLNAGADANYGKGLVLLGQKKIPEAGAAFQAAFSNRPSFAEAHQQMAVVLLEGKKYEDAEGEFESALIGFIQNQVPRARLLELRDDFVNRLKKGAPKEWAAKFAENANATLH